MALVMVSDTLMIRLSATFVMIQLVTLTSVVVTLERVAKLATMFVTMRWETLMLDSVT